jgi:hypothetical protein
VTDAFGKVKKIKQEGGMERNQPVFEESKFHHPDFVPMLSYDEN